MLSNAHFLAKFRFDTAENEPSKNLQYFANFPNLRVAHGGAFLFRHWSSVVVRGGRGRPSSQWSPTEGSAR